MKTLGNRAFEGCSGATKLTIPATLKVINNYCFSGCSGLTEIKIPEGIVEIGREAFNGCTGAKMIRLPKSLVQVGNNAFSGRPASGWILWEECQGKDVVYLGSDALGTAGYLMAPLGSAAEEYAMTHKIVVFCNTKIKDFVVRCYDKILGRAPDEAGMLDWCSQIASGKKGGSAIVQAFIGSQEFINKKYNDEQVVKILYQAMLGREADANGLNDWMNMLKTGVTYDSIIYGFTGSQEFINLCKTYSMTPGTITLSKARDKNWGLTAYVSRMYTECLGRNFDVNGLENWCQQVLTNRINVVDVARGFFFSKEFVDKKLSDTEYVHRLYRTMFGRNEDAAGMLNWMAALNQKKTREFVFEGFTGSAEFKALVESFGLKLPEPKTTKKKK